MANDRDFILSLVGALDETKTKENVQNALDRISKNVSLKSKSKIAKEIGVFDKDQLKKDGIAYLKSVKDIESQLSEMFKGIGTNFSIKRTFADDGTVSKFVATIYEGTKAIQTLNFEATKFTDKTLGFRQVGGTATSDKFTTTIASEIEMLKAETEQIDLQEVFLTRLNQAKQMLNDGSISSDSLKFGKLNEDIRLLESQIKSIDFSKIGIEGELHLDKVTDATLKAVEAEHKLYNTTMNKKTGVFNIPALEKEGISFYKNTVGVVEQVKQELEAKGYTPKISILGRDSEGAVTSFTAQIKNASGVIDNLYYDLVRLTDGEKEFNGFMTSFGKQIDNTSQEYAKALSDQTKKLSKARTDLDDLMTKFLTGNGNKVLSGDERSNDILNKLTEAEAIINRLNSNVGRNTPEEIEGVTKLISQIKKEADEYVNLENKQKRIKDEADKTAKAYDNQKYKLESLSQEARKLYDSTFNGKNNLVNEKNITNAQNKLKNLSLFLDGLYAKHDKGDLIPEDALARFDLKIKEYTQDIKNMKDNESLQKSLIGNTESQLNALNTIENKILSIQSKMLDGNKITTPSYISDISNQVANASNTIETLRNKAGSITDSESRNLVNIVSTLQREADEYARIDSGLQKQKKDLNDIWNQLQGISRTTLNPNASGVLGDPEHLRTVRKEYSQAIELVYKLQKQNESGKVIDVDTMQKASGMLAKLNQDITVFKQEETLIKNATKSMENQLTTLNNFEQKAKSLRSSYLSNTGDNLLIDPKNVSGLETKLTSLENRISSMRNTTATNNEATYRELTNEYNEAVRLAQGYAHVEREQQKHIAAVEKQKNQLLDYKRGIDDLYNLNLDPSVKGALKNAKNIYDVNKSIVDLRSELQVLIDNNNNGLEITNERMNQFGQSYKNLTSQVTYARGREGLEAMDLKNAQAQINKFAEMERSLDNFRAKYYGNGSPTRLTDSLYIDETVKKLQVLDNMVSMFKSNAGNITDAQINEYRSLRNELDITAQRYANLETIQKKETQTIDDQKYILESYYLELKKIRETTLNPNSAFSLTESENINRITDNVTKLEQKYQELRAKNNSGALIDKNELKETDLLLKEINQDIKIIGKEDSSNQNFNDRMIKTRANLHLLIGDLERQGKLTGNVRTEIEKFVKEILNIKTPTELNNFIARFDAFKIMLEDARRDEEALFNDNNFRQKLQLLSSQVSGYINQNTRAAILFKSSFDKLKQGIANASNDNDLIKLQNEFKLLQQNINNAGKAGLTFGERMSSAIKKFMMWTGMTNTVMYLVRSIKQMVTNVRELDSAMVSLKKVTDETDYTYKQIFEGASEKAKELNTSIKDIINSTAEFAKLGFSTSQAQGLAEVANVYANVGEMDIQSATESLVSTINGFKDLNADDAWKIIDEFNNVGNKFSISSAGIGEALKRSAASLSESNNSLEESIALVTTANSVIQDPEKVGTALRTMSLRIRGVKTELEKAGLETDGMIESTAKLRDLVMAATGVDILEKDQKTFRSTYEILLDISKVWGDMNDELQKSAVLEALAGKLQSNILASILNNGEMLADVYDKAGKSENSAMQEQERWANSLEAKAKKLTSIFESISTKVFESESLKSIFDGLAKILDLIDKLVGNGNGLQLLAGTLGGILGGSGNGFINANTFGGFWKNAFKDIRNYNKTLAGSATLQAEYASSVQSTNASLSKYLLSLNGAKAGIVGYTANVITATIKTTAFRVAMTVLNSVINGLAFAGLGLLISALGNAINSYDDMKEKLVDVSNELRNNIDDLESYKTNLDKVIESDASESEKLKELNQIKDEIHKKYQTEIGDLKDVAEAREILNNAIDKEQKNRLRDYVNNTDNQKAYEEAKRRLNDSFVNYLAPKDMGLFDLGAWKQMFLANVQDIKDWWNGVYQNEIGKFSFINPGETLNISQDIVDLFDEIGNGTINGDHAFTFEIAFNGDEQAYFKKLKSIYDEFSDIRSLRIDELSDDEEKLFQMINYQYQKLTSENGKFIEGIDEMARSTAQLMMLTTEQGDMSNQEYFDDLSKLTSDTYVIDALRELIFTSDDLKESLENSDPALASILSNFSKIAETCKTVRDEIDEADESFEKLTKTINDNKDVDKFFSASDIIELLELYPSLNDAILESAYGYKIEEDALEALRDAKLSEKKTALQAQLDETKTLLEATKNKLELYKQELKGVENVAVAKARLVELESKYAQLGSNTTNPYYNNSSLESQIAKYNDYIKASEEVEKYEQKLKELDIDVKVLGTDFDTLKNSTDDATKALNDQKDSIKELNDAMKDGQDAINDLIKLTMEMIKKQKSLERDALKEQLDNFKKLIDKRKELIDLEKEQYEFEKQIKDKNKDYMKIRQEYDALNVEGVQYSLEDLKRKAELEEQINDKKSDMDDFLYKHEVEVRKDALDKEQEAFEDQINSQVKTIEDYLDRTGKIRADAIALINGKSQQFYDDLLSYTMNYTDKSRFEFDKLWNDAYDAILKYAGGMLDVDLALANIISSMALADAQLKAIENSINNIKNATDAMKDSLIEYNKVAGDTQSKFATLYSSPIGAGLPNSPLYNETQEFLNNIRKNKYHSGGVVEGVTNEHGEVLAKLLKGEVVVTEAQARNFMSNTLPKLAGNSVVNNSTMSPVINMGDIIIQGDADSNTVNQLNALRKNIVGDVFKELNSQRNTFNGGRVRTV